MLNDYTIREEDRPEIIHTLILELIDIKSCKLIGRSNNTMNRVILSMLYRKIQFGYYSTLQLYELLFRLHTTGFDGLHHLWCEELTEIPFASIFRTMDMRVQDEEVTRDKMWESPIIRDLFGMVLTESMAHYQKIAYIGQYTVPEFIEVPEPPKKRHMVKVKNFLASCIGLSRQPEIFETRQP